ncbi:MAG: ABC transporter permease [Acidimicrobiia bacterium]|nr:ABC transporter permease [Acidimicrobiia bacterium]
MSGYHANAFTKGSPLGRYVIKRFVQMVVLFLVFFALSWIALQAIPGNSIEQQLRLNPNLPPEAITQALARRGLDKPPLEQFWIYTKNFFTGDLGVSWSRYPQPVSKLIAERLPRTVMLFSVALLFQYLIGFQAGKYLAWRRNKRGEIAITIAGVSLFTVFYPWFGLMMILLFAVKLGWVPTNGFIVEATWRDAPVSANHVMVVMFFSLLAVTAFIGLTSWASSRLDRPNQRRLVKIGAWVVGLGGFWLFWATNKYLVYAKDVAIHLVLPVSVLTMVGFAGVMLITRTSMLETMKEDFVTTARAKGLSEAMVRDRHAARTALLPVSTSLVLAVATVIDGGIITESVFGWPGMGQLLLASVVSEDIPVALAAFSFTGILALLGHFAADILYGVLDPRIRVTSQG